MKFALITFGCRVNQADSQTIEHQLLARGATRALPEAADLVIVNSCSVTATADQGVRQTVRRVVRQNPSASIVVTGCYASRRPDDVAALPGVSRIVPNSDKDNLASLLFEPADDGTTTAKRYGDGDLACGAQRVPGLGGRTALTLRVQTGCSELCSYCIIPQTRGRPRSKPMADVLADVRLAVGSGYKEIVIAGVHLGSYGRDLGDGSSLLSLVAALAAWDADVLFRISSLEPMDCPIELVDAVAASPRLAPHFHLPLQHGSDAVLRSMRRPYTVAAYESLLSHIHARLPHASIGTDIIVGFPSETEVQMQEMQDVLRRLPLTHLHVFPYSDRPGTDAADMREKVDGAVVRARGKAIRDIGSVLSARFRSAQIGTVTRALSVDDGWSAVTPNFLKVRLNRQQPRNTWIDVRIGDGDPLAGLVQQPA